VTTAEQGEQRLVDELLLARDDAAYLGAALLEDLKGGLDVLLGCEGFMELLGLVVLTHGGDFLVGLAEVMGDGAGW
jgi:hypothetical protein